MRNEFWKCRKYHTHHTHSILVISFHFIVNLVFAVMHSSSLYYAFSFYHKVFSDLFFIILTNHIVELNARISLRNAFISLCCRKSFFFIRWINEIHLLVCLFSTKKKQNKFVIFNGFRIESSIIKAFYLHFISLYCYISSECIHNNFNTIKTIKMYL